MAEVKPKTTVEVKSPVASKINWIQGIGLVAGLGSFFGLNVPPETLAAVETTIVGATTVVTWIMRTWFTKTVVSTAVPK